MNNSFADEDHEPIRVWLYGDGFCSIDGEFAEQRRPRGEGRAIPAQAMRREMDIRGGYCLCKSYLTAVKEGK